MAYGNCTRGLQLRILRDSREVTSRGRNIPSFIITDLNLLKSYKKKLPAALNSKPSECQLRKRALGRPINIDGQDIMNTRVISNSKTQVVYIIFGFRPAIYPVIQDSKTPYTDTQDLICCVNSDSRKSFLSGSQACSVLSIILLLLAHDYNHV